MEANLNKVLNPRPVLAGMLLKYTNYMKGYQVRYFQTDAQKGILSYYLCDGPEDNPQPILSANPRGQIKLLAAVISPHAEDSRTFLINCANGEILKLRAADSKTRQEWVDGLRAIVESHDQALSMKSPLSVRDSLATFDALDACRQQLHVTETCNANLIRSIEGATSPTDPDLLVLKALSATTTTVLFQCLGLLQKFQEFQGDTDSLVASN